MSGAKNRPLASFAAWILIFGLACTPAAAQETEQPPAEEAPEATATEAGAEPEAPEEPPGADLSEASALVRQQEYAEADAVLAKILEEFPDDPAALLMRGEVLLALGHQLKARPLLEKCVLIDPERARAHFQLATVLQMSGDVQGALENFGREIDVNEDEQIRTMARLNRSLIYQQQRLWDEAAAELEAVLEMDPDQPQIYGDLTAMYLQSGNLDAAADALDRGVEAGFSSARHFYILGSRYYKNEKVEESIAAFKKALGLNPGFADAEKSLGVALDQLGRADEAVRHLQRYLDLRPDAPEAEQIRKRIAEVEAG